MTFNARLFNAPKMRAIVEITDDIAEECDLIADALADYENADDLPSEERSDARNEARDEAWSHIGELLNRAQALEALRESLYAEGEIASR